MNDHARPHRDTAGLASLAFRELMAIRGGDDIAPAELAVKGADPFFRSPYRIGEVVSSTLAATGVAANDIWEMRTGSRQRLSVDVRHAAASLRTVDYTQRLEEDGEFRNIPIPDTMSHMISITQPWATKDGRWLLPHFNLPHLADRVLTLLDCDSTPESVSAAVARWNSDELEDAIAAANACGGKIRTPEEWLSEPAGAYLAGRPVVEITRVGDSEPESFVSGPRPLSGVRVLDLTRILAGPISGRTLAEHGADVLMVTAPDLPQTWEHVRDTSHGKRSTFLDYRTPGEAERLRELVQGADVFVDGYRPGRMQAHGFGAEELMRLRPGLIYLSVSCFGSAGPLAGRAGWEQVAQAVTGICHVNGKLTAQGRPKLVFAPMCDYTTGYLGAYGVMLALARRAREGGSYHVHVSLCQSAMFIQRQGLMEAYENAPQRLDADEIEASYVTSDTSYGRLRTLGPALKMSQTPCYWDRPTPRLGGDQPVWNARG